MASSLLDSFNYPNGNLNNQANWVKSDTFNGSSPVTELQVFNNSIRAFVSNSPTTQRSFSSHSQSLATVNQFAQCTIDIPVDNKSVAQLSLRQQVNDNTAGAGDFYLVDYFNFLGDGRIILVRQSSGTQLGSFDITPVPTGTRFLKLTVKTNSNNDVLYIGL